MGQVGRVLGRDAGAAGRRRGLHLGGLAVAGIDARPDRGRGADRSTGCHRQLDQRRRMGRRDGRASGGDDRCTADLAGAAGEPAVRGATALAARRLRVARDRRSALRVRLGLRLPTRLPTADPNAPGADPRDAGAGDDGDGQRTGHPRRGRPARLGHHHPAGLARPRLVTPGRGAGARSRAAVRVGGRCPGRAGRFGDHLRADGGGDRTGCRVVAVERVRRRRLFVEGGAGRARSSWKDGCVGTRSRRWWRRRPSAWATTSPTWRSASTSARRRRRSPTTSRSAGRAAPSTRRSQCCCPPSPTSGCGTTSPRPGSPSRITSMPSCRRSPAERRPCRRSSPSPSCGGAGWKRCSRSSPSTTSWCGARTAGRRPAHHGSTTRRSGLRSSRCEQPKPT